MTTEQQKSSSREENEKNDLHKDVEVKSIPFLDEELKYFIIKTSMNCKGNILVFSGWPGSPADPSANLKYAVNLDNQLIHLPATSFRLSSLTDYGYNLIVFDYPGFWFSPGPFSLPNGIQVGVKILTNLKNDYPNVPIYVFGHSFGGAMALNCVSEFKNVKKMFFHSPTLPTDCFESGDAVNELMALEKLVADQHFVNSTEKWWESERDGQIFIDKLQLENKITKINELAIPLKVVIGKNDGIFSATKAKDFYSKFNVDVEILDNAPHSDTYYLPELLKQQVLRIINYFNT